MIHHPWIAHHPWNSQDRRSDCPGSADPMQYPVCCHSSQPHACRQGAQRCRPAEPITDGSPWPAYHGTRMRRTSRGFAEATISMVAPDRQGGTHSDPEHTSRSERRCSCLRATEAIRMTPVPLPRAVNHVMEVRNPWPPTQQGPRLRWISIQHCCVARPTRSFDSRYTPPRDLRGRSNHFTNRVSPAHSEVHDHLLPAFDCF